MQPTPNSASWILAEPEMMDTDKYLSSSNAPLIEEDARLCIQSGARKMILNCAPLAYMTGAGVRALLGIARLMNEVGGSLSVQGLNGQPREIFMACGMDAVIPLLDEMPVLSAVSAA